MRRPAFLIRPVVLYLFVVLILAIAFTIACSSGDNKSAEPTSTPPQPTDAKAIRSVEITKTGDVQNTLRQLQGSSVDAKQVIYGDVTGDLREEAIVPLSSQGTQGNLAYLVFTLKGSDVSLVLTRGLGGGSGGTGSGLQMEIEEGKLVETTAELGPEDPLCCPSLLRKTYFRWDGSKLQVEKEEKVEGSGTKKD